MNAVNTSISIRNLLLRFRGRISLTLLLVIFDAIFNILFPLFIGFAINSLLEQSYRGVIALAALGVLTLIIGSFRRFYDTRVYSKIYVTIADEMVVNEQAKGSSVSIQSARAALLTEFVEFLENSMPEIVNSVLGIVGIIVIIATLQVQVFWACLGLLALMVLVYMVSARWNILFNKNYNDRLEERVHVLEAGNKKAIKQHFNALMRWNIRLSDLETSNYAIIWLGIIALLTFSTIVTVQAGVSNYGQVFSILTYVFQYVESVVMLPLFIQQALRLKEISGRLAES